MFAEHTIHLLFGHGDSVGDSRNYSKNTRDRRTNDPRVVQKLTTVVPKTIGENTKYVRYNETLEPNNRQNTYVRRSLTTDDDIVSIDDGLVT